MRSLSLRLPGKPNLFGRPDTIVTLTEQPDDHTILFEFAPRNKRFDDFFAVFFDVNSPPLASALKVTGSRITATNFGDDTVTEVGGAVLKGSKIPKFDAGVKFGPPHLRNVDKLSFVLGTTNGTFLTLDNLAHADFGLRHSKLAERFVTILPAAPDVKDDDEDAFEDTSTTFNVLVNDTDADLADILRVVSFSDPDHGRS